MFCACFFQYLALAHFPLGSDHFKRSLLRMPHLWVLMVLLQGLLRPAVVDMHRCFLRHDPSAQLGPQTQHLLRNSPRSSSNFNCYAHSGWTFLMFLWLKV